jgi:glycosyltransferase involved in cell wall biosynthesis
MKPEISLIIPNYNKGLFLEQTLKSVQANTFERWEAIVVDDGSSDNSLALLKQLVLHDSRIQLVTQTNQGGGNARQKGMSLAKGDYLIFLDADDLLSPTCLESRMKQASLHPHFDGWVFPIQPFHENLTQLGTPWTPPKDHFLQRIIGHEIIWSVMSPIWKTDYIQQNGIWDTQLARLQDVQFHTDLLLKGARIKTFPDYPPDAFYRQDQNRIVLGDYSTFMEKWVDAVERYCSLTLPQLPQEWQRTLDLTPLACLQTLGHYFRIGFVPKGRFVHLAERLILTTSPANRKHMRRYFVHFLRIPFHLPGVHWWMKKRMG